MPPSKTQQPAAHDTVFAVESIREDFVFNQHVVEVFDDMLSRSVPFYQEVLQSSISLLDRYLRPSDSVYDLGCATGTSLLEFSRHLSDKKLRFYGVDSSPAMLEKARMKAKLYTGKENLTFLEDDITTMSFPETGAFIVHYTLQFLRPLQREAFLQKLLASLRPGGILLLSEKIISHDTRLNREYIDIYHTFKKSRGYSELEIARKREALENVLIPFSISENIDLLHRVGFNPVETFFQWFNFTSFIAVKPD